MDYNQSEHDRVIEWTSQQGGNGTHTHTHNTGYMENVPGMIRTQSWFTPYTAST